MVVRTEPHKDVAFIEQLFFQQMKSLSTKQAVESFDVQHSDLWI